MRGLRARVAASILSGVAVGSVMCSIALQDNNNGEFRSLDTGQLQWNALASLFGEWALAAAIVVAAGLLAGVWLWRNVQLHRAMAQAAVARPIRPHPENAPGDFYVQDGCCITCGVPVDTAPAVFDWADYPSHCIVKRQPGDEQEVTQTLEAMLDSEADCIRYQGQDADIARRIVEMGMAECLDSEAPADAVMTIRDRVSFATRLAPHEAARRYRAYLQKRSDERGQFPFAFNDASLVLGGHEVRFAWSGDTFHTVSFEADEEPGRLIAIARPNQRIQGAHGGLARDVGRWLTREPAASDLRWYAERQWLAGGPWSTRPF